MKLLSSVMDSLESDSRPGGMPGNSRKPTLPNGRNWPGPGFPGGRRKLTLTGRAIAPKVSFLAPPRTHTDGQERAVALLRHTGHSLRRDGVKSSDSGQPWSL